MKRKGRDNLAALAPIAAVGLCALGLYLQAGNGLRVYLPFDAVRPAPPVQSAAKAPVLRLASADRKAIPPVVRPGV